MKTNTISQNRYYSSDFTSLQEAINWVETVLHISINGNDGYLKVTQDHFIVNDSDLPPLGVKVDTYDQRDEDKVICKVQLRFELSKNNSISDILKLRRFFLRLQEINVKYNDYEIDSYEIVYILKSNDGDSCITLFSYINDPEE